MHEMSGEYALSLIEYALTHALSLIEFLPTIISCDELMTAASKHIVSSRNFSLVTLTQILHSKLEHSCEFVNAS